MKITKSYSKPHLPSLAMLWAPTPQNDQTQSNNLLSTTIKLFECVWPFCEVGI